MKKLILVSAVALMSSGAFAQSSQSQGGAQAGTNGNVAATPNGQVRQNGMRDGTVGMSSGMQTGTRSSGPNGTASDRPAAKGGPVGQPSQDEAAPK
jgi:hypothetical protein